MYEFFMAIAFNNSREFFEENRAAYEAEVKRPLYALAEALAPAALAVDPGMEVRPSRVVSRIRRDTRFTRDKSPYRDHMWLGYHPASRHKSLSFSLYFDISCTAMHYGGGFYEDTPERAKRLRETIQRRQKDFLAIATAPALTRLYEVKGTPYKRLGIPESLPVPLLPYYNNKGFYLEHTETPGAQTMRPELVQQVAEGFAALRPLYQFLMEEGF